MNSQGKLFKLINLFRIYIIIRNHHVIVWRPFLNGAKKLRIGELSKATNVTKRTIDYYTNLGLLIAERSPSNYRLYDESAIDRLLFIEKCKQNQLSLTEIKKELIDRYAEEIDVQEIRAKIHEIEQEVSSLITHMGKDQEVVKKHVDSTSLIQSMQLLMLLLTKS